MKNLLLLFAAMLLTSSVAVAQLYVTPNGATDSYVYVNDQILFVEQDVNLVENNAGTEQASIYLRNQSQLIQGATASANSGTGYISVIQNAPNDDSWDYSFWSSPIGNQTLGASGNQNFGILRVFDSLSVTNSVVTATTTSVNGTESPLTISRRWLYKYPAGGPWQALHLNNIVAPGQGFTMKGVGTTNHNQKYDFRGRPNNGNIDVAVIATEATFSGNPYPSALDLNRVFWDADNTEITEFWYWDEDRTIDSHMFTANKGGYGVYVPGASDPNGTTENGLYTLPQFLNYDSAGNPSGGSIGSGASYDRRFAPIGQGFMIYAGSSSGTITFKNSHRRYIVEGAANDSQFRNPGNDNVLSSPLVGIDPSDGNVDEPDNRIPQIRIHTFFGESHYRDMVLALSDESTDGYDRGYDGRHPMDASKGEAYFPIAVGQDTNIKPFVIQTVPFDLTKRIPITFELDKEFPVSVKVVEEVNLPTTAAYLLDTSDNVAYKITGGDSADIFLPAGDYKDRFYIVFRNSPNNDIIDGNSTGLATKATTNSNEQIRGSVDFFQNNSVAQLEVNNPEGYDIKTAHVYDMAGKLVITQNNIGPVRNFSFSTASLSDGVYLVKLTTVDNVAIDYKMTIHNKR